jgi:hypothetical protein
VLVYRTSIARTTPDDAVRHIVSIVESRTTVSELHRRVHPGPREVHGGGLICRVAEGHVLSRSPWSSNANASTAIRAATHAGRAQLLHPSAVNGCRSGSCLAQAIYTEAAAARTGEPWASSPWRPDPLWRRPTAIHARKHDQLGPAPPRSSRKAPRPKWTIRGRSALRARPIDPARPGWRVDPGIVAAAPSTVAASVGRGATTDSRSDGSAIGTLGQGVRAASLTG